MVIRENNSGVVNGRQNAASVTGETGMMADDKVRPAICAFVLTSLMFLALPYVHLMVPPDLPSEERFQLQRVVLPDTPLLPPPVRAEPFEAPDQPLLPELPLHEVKSLPIEPVLDFDFSLDVLPGDFGAAFSLDAFPGMADGALLFDLSDVDQAPQAMSQMRPLYPAHARRRRIEGEVTVLFTVNTEGRVQEIEVLSGEPVDVFETAARRAVDHWRFRPALKDGVPVPVRVRQVIRFRMED